MNSQNLEESLRQNDDVPSSISKMEQECELYREITNLNLSKSCYEFELDRLEHLLEIEKSDSKMLKCYSPWVLIPFSGICLIGAISGVGLLAGGVCLGTALISGAYSFDVICTEYPKINRNRSKNIIEASKELCKGRKKILAEYVDVSQDLSKVNEEIKSKEQEYNDLKRSEGIFVPETKEEEISDSLTDQSVESFEEEDPLFVTVWEEAQAEEKQVDRPKVYCKTRHL